ncbi:hypothetical protein ONS96_005651 [Cadophora gregata f. sp. sojae]|nr:hypothetical protein ONS96_005651 [Cadophora gregata f. sp. sojae]
MRSKTLGKADHRPMNILPFLFVSFQRQTITPGEACSARLIRFDIGSSSQAPENTVSAIRKKWHRERRGEALKRNNQPLETGPHFTLICSPVSRKSKVHIRPLLSSSSASTDTPPYVRLKPV